MYEKWSKILSHTQLFKNIDTTSINTMLNCLKPPIHEFAKNEYITVEGDTFEGIGIILLGEATIAKENMAGNRIIVHSIKQGDIFGEMVAFSNKNTWPVSVNATQKTTVVFLPPEKITGSCVNMCFSHQELILNLLNLVSNRGLFLNKRIEYLSIKNVREKISVYLLEQYERAGKIVFKIPHNRNELAEFLNVTRPSLSREMAKMRDEGIIEFQKSSVALTDIDALKSSVH
ncbi:helix-turn-helix domain-containing protein [Alkalibaculum sp. M08DMB]|uniref:Helix-turn-helix domain-containing protein n=1 Tax=Alkalibaculum sporogenes TaxID=2655001 RepID=A0A6A7K7J4_9FIRM|nr:Crp/Fnr family transcriptional regulator [Alkalibaculum sporogenes]MPW25073.1 helix-turn-helix domain-containing protein [Alkalibaculum sporogenes]